MPNGSAGRSLRWIDEVFQRLPGCDDDLFTELWSRRAIVLADSQDRIDSIDEYNARLVCAALSGRHRLLIVLPDTQIRRPALLFATAVLRHAISGGELVQSSNARQPLLYFGSSVGIREQLASVKMRRRRQSVDLAAVFHQEDVARGAVGVQPAALAPPLLPRVVTVYAPADPCAVLAQYRPAWIAIDCFDDARASWFEPLVQDAARLNLPVIAWTRNPLSESIGAFERYGDVFVWPYRVALDATANRQQADPVTQLGDALLPNRHTVIRPVMIEGDAVERSGRPISEAIRILSSAESLTTGRLAGDALRVHWRLLRSLESLSVPASFYEAESRRYWGLRSLTDLQAACEQFRNASANLGRDFQSLLARASTYLAEASAVLFEDDPPLWRVLSNLSIQEPEAGAAHVIVFPSKARRDLFLFAMLARFNVSVDDLRSLRIWIASFDDMRRTLWQRSVRPSSQSQQIDALNLDPSLRLKLSLIGVPTSSSMPRAWPVLLETDIDVIALAHQYSPLERRMNDWERRLGTDLARASSIVARLAHVSSPSDIEPVSPRFVLGGASSIDVGSIRVSRVDRAELWKALDPVTEITRLMESDDELSFGDEATVTERPEDDSAPDESLVWSQTAVSLGLEQGWKARFAPDERVNVVVEGRGTVQLDRRAASALRQGDRVLLIHGQRRQDLYELIISRVHQSPSIELHVALIKRWQAELATAYEQWHLTSGRNLESLLNELRQRGSGLTSSLTLRFWLLRTTMCPLDPEDLRRVADVLNMAFVGRYYRDIERAAARLRGLHRGLANRLNRWLECQVTGAGSFNDDEVIDAELGLTLRDFRSSLLLLRVLTVESEAGPFLRSSLGRVDRESADER